MILDSSLFWSSERSFSTDKYAFRKYWSKKEEGQNREERKNREGGGKHFSQEGEKKEKKGGVIGRMGIFGIKNRRRSEKENILEKEFCVCGRTCRRDSKEGTTRCPRTPKERIIWSYNIDSIIHHCLLNI